MDILIFRIIYPNDRYGRLNVHQHFVGYLDDEYLIFYSISSILGKEKRLFDEYGNYKDEFEVFIGESFKECNFKVPSFIDCSKSYKLLIKDKIDLSKLSYRNIKPKYKANIEKRINKLKREGKHTEYYISQHDFLKYNNKCKIN